jgi:hypothetical protein
MKTIKLIILFLILCLPDVFCQSVELINAKKIIHDYGVFDSREDGKKLTSEVAKLNIHDLLELVSSDSSLEKTYAFWAIIKYHDYDYRPLLLGLISDNRPIKFKRVGCKVSRGISTGKIIFQLAENVNNSYGDYSNEGNFLDSLAFEDYDQELNKVFSQRLFRVEINERNYPKLRKKAFDDVPQAYSRLAQYRKEQDIPFFKKLLNPNSKKLFSGLSCVKIFPHKDFEDDLLVVFEKQLSHKFPYSFTLTCEVLLNYKSENVKNSFDKMFSSPDKYFHHLICLWAVFERTKDFDNPLRNRILNVLDQEEIRRGYKEFSSIEYYGKGRREREKFQK